MCSGARSPATAVQLLHVQYSESACPVHTGCVFFGTLAICVCHPKNYLFGVFLVKKSPEKHSWSLLFALRYHECDSWLPVNLRSSAAPVSLFTVVCPLGVARALECTHTCSLIGRCVATPSTSEWAMTTVCCWRLQCSIFTDSAQRAQGMCSVLL